MNNLEASDSQDMLTLGGFDFQWSIIMGIWQEYAKLLPVYFILFRNTKTINSVSTI